MLAMYSLLYMLAGSLYKCTVKSLWLPSLWNCRIYLLCDEIAVFGIKCPVCSWSELQQLSLAKCWTHRSENLTNLLVAFFFPSSMEDSSLCTETMSSLTETYSCVKRRTALMHVYFLQTYQYVFVRTTYVACDFCFQDCSGEGVILCPCI